MPNKNVRSPVEKFGHRAFLIWTSFFGAQIALEEEAEEEKKQKKKKKKGAWEEEKKSKLSARLCDSISPIFALLNLLLSLLLAPHQ